MHYADLDGFTMFTTNDKRPTEIKKMIFLPILLAICVLLRFAFAVKNISDSYICWKKGHISPIPFRYYANMKIFAIASALKKRLIVLISVGVIYGLEQKNTSSKLKS